ncbi:MAG TPA: flagellar hook-basal body complex protein FliE [Solirubrobacteraceae bacterium]|jgi:flagellar hook-basal body complex protein FliE|nr:flagellar hook-basal body complex protein FliE [Solirubrobacteraceae bacterium]
MIIPPIGGLGSELALGHSAVVAPGAGAGTSGVAAGGEAGGAGGFGGELTEAISSLEQTQNSASSAAQALATGQVADPESAIVTVQNAQLAMELASQIRNKATEATQSIFNTQV